jgi:transcriptional regulator with XRE-family HTH domain
MGVMSSSTRPNESVSGHHGDDPTRLAEKVEGLFALHPADRGEYTNQEVADAVNETAGETLVTASGLEQLRAGLLARPSDRCLWALAEFFGVPTAYLLGGDAELDARMAEELDDLAAMRRHQVRAVVGQVPVPGEGQTVAQDLAARVAGLAPEARNVTLRVLAGPPVAAATASIGLPDKDRQRV